MRCPSEKRPTLLALLTVLALPALVFAGGISDCPEKKVCSYSRNWALTCDVLNENNCTHWYAAVHPPSRSTAACSTPAAMLIEPAAPPMSVAARSSPYHTSQEFVLLRRYW